MNSTTRQARHSKPSIRSQYDPIRWLAAGVMLRAVRDYRIWHTDEAKEYRSATPAVRYAKFKHKKDEWHRAASGPDPGKWLFRSTWAHFFLELDPEHIQSAMRSGKEVHIRDVLPRAVRMSKSTRQAAQMAGFSDGDSFLRACRARGVDASSVLGGRP